MRNELLEAAHAWWLSKRPSGMTEAEHKARPWMGVFGSQETMLAVACADGPEDCIIAAALAWYYSDRKPATKEVSISTQFSSSMFQLSHLMMTTTKEKL